VIHLDYRAILLLGFVLVMTGAILPWLMVLHVIRSTWALNFLSFTASVAGLFLGAIGAAYYTRLHHK